MKSFGLTVFLILMMVAGYGQLFSIVDESGQILPSEVTIISGMSMSLGTNFEQLGVEYVTFESTDNYSVDGLFQIGFDFRFYDETPQQFHISPTGFIIFEQTPGFPIRFRNEPIPFPDGANLINSIYGCFMPWNPVNGQFVSLYRGFDNQLVISWCDVPVEMNPGQPIPTGNFQIVLHSNDDIDIHLIDIPRSDLFSGQATVGVLSQVKSRHTAATGMNNTDWPPRIQESWRFSPDNDHFRYGVSLIPVFDPVLVPEYITWLELDDAGNEISEIETGFRLSISPQITTTYRAVLRTCWGDEIERDEITINVAGTFPTAFNPYSAYPNNEFRMILESGLPIDDFRLQIYNRWGQLVFETIDYELGWNGKMNNSGTDCPAGVYNWVILLETDSKSRVTNTGSVMLIR